jgi:prepilin-type N-terminal cleavage/methylation domain-containing protein
MGASHTPRRRRAEHGFTLVELIVVVLIIAVLMAAAIVAVQEAKRTARAKAMATAGASVAQAISAYERMHPPITTDPLTAVSTFTQPQTEAAGGLYSTTGERLLDPWPTNPYTGQPVTIQRVANCPAMPAIGGIVVCRLPATAKRSDYRVMAAGKNKDGAAYIVYDASFG